MGSGLHAVLALLAGYLLGSIPTAAWICRAVYGADITKVGSGNPGMTNVLRTYGWKPALPVALLDAGKGCLAAWLGASLAGSQAWGLAAGSAAVLGHSFTCFARFKGGKSVLTGFGVFLYFAPLSALAGLLTWSAAVALTRYVSLGSILAALVLPTALFLEIRLGGRRELAPVLYAAVFISVFVIIRHRANLARLLNGTERRIGGKPAPGQEAHGKS
jgi:glycerol-3-phosphate acyltransferase PlsY